MQRHNRIIKSIICLFIVSLILLSGCSTKSDKKTLNIGVGKITGNFNPFYASEDGDISVINQLFRTIQRRGTDNKLINSAGSISYEYVGETQVKYTVTIQNDLFFSNGSNVTIDDIIFFYYFISDALYDGIYSDFYLNDIVGLKEYYYDDLNYSDKLDLFSESPDKDNLTQNYITQNYSDGIDVSEITGIKRIDDYTCTVLFNSRNINSISQLNAVVVSKAFYSENYVKGKADRVESIADSAVGCGPYAVTSYNVADGTVTLSANTFSSDKPSFENVKMVSCKADDAVNKLASGELDIISVEATDSVINKLSSDKIKYSVSNKAEYVSLYFNERTITDVDVRKNLASLCYVDKLLDNEIGSSCTKLLRPLSIRFEEYPSDADRYYTDSSSSGKLKNKISSLNLYCCADKDSLEKKAADFIADNLSKVGIKVTVTVCNYDKLVSAAKSNKADMWIMANPDGDTCDKFDYFNTNGDKNLSGVSLPSVDLLTEQIRSSTGLSDRKSSVSAMLDFLMTNASEVPLYQRQIVTAYNTSKIDEASLSDIDLYDGYDYILTKLY